MTQVRILIPLKRLANAAVAQGYNTTGRQV